MNDNKIREIRIIRENPRFRRYPEYKESGVEWIGKIPAHWKIKKIKHVATFVSEKSTPETDDIKISPENVESKTGKVLDFYSSYDSIGVKFQVGDVLFNKIRVYLNKVVFAEYGGYSLGEMIVIRPSLEDIGKYLFYLMLSSRFIEYCNSISKGAKMPRTDVYDILNAQIPITSYQEQTQIANFLDRKTEQIDALIRLKERRIELLQAQRTALINQGVTKGLDPNVEMKPSGMEWIGEIPKNWDTVRCTHLFEVKHIKNTSGEINLSVYRDYGVIKRDSRDDNYNRVSEDTSNYKLVDPGDFVFNKMKCWQGSLGISEYRGIVSPAYTVCKPKRPFHGKYFHYLLRSWSYIQEFNRLSYGVRIGQWELRFEDFKDIVVPYPSVLEQAQIANFLNDKTQQINELIAAEHRKIELLQEYRQSLISEAVTGKIDVRNEV